MFIFNVVYLIYVYFYFEKSFLKMIGMSLLYVGYCKYGEKLAKKIVDSLQNVLWSCGSVRISFSRRTPLEVYFFSNTLSICPIPFMCDHYYPRSSKFQLLWASIKAFPLDPFVMLIFLLSSSSQVFFFVKTHSLWRCTLIRSQRSY